MHLYANIGSALDDLGAIMLSLNSDEDDEDDFPDMDLYRNFQSTIPSTSEASPPVTPVRKESFTDIATSPIYISCASSSRTQTQLVRQSNRDSNH